MLGIFGFRQCAEPGVPTGPAGVPLLPFPPVCASGVLTVGVQPLGLGSSNVNVWLDLMLTSYPGIGPFEVRGSVFGSASGGIVGLGCDPAAGCVAGIFEGGGFGRPELFTIGMLVDPTAAPTVTLTGANVFVDYSWGGPCCGTAIIRAVITPVPEPSTYALLGSGLLGIGGIRRWRGRRSA